LSKDEVIVNASRLAFLGQVPVRGTSVQVAPSQEAPVTIPIINQQLPSTVMGVSTKTLLIGGGIVVGAIIILKIL
jgi:hypothetical protein